MASCQEVKESVLEKIVRILKKIIPKRTRAKETERITLTVSA